MIEKKILDRLLIGLILFEILFSVYLVYDAISDKGICAVGGGCDVVKNSIYSEIFGVKLVYFALFSFVLLGILFHFNRRVYLIASFLGFVFALYLIVLQLFVISAICFNCMIVDLTMILIFVLSFLDFKRDFSKKAKT